MPEVCVFAFYCNLKGNIKSRYIPTNCCYHDIVSTDWCHRIHSDPCLVISRVFSPLVSCVTTYRCRAHFSCAASNDILGWSLRHIHRIDSVRQYDGESVPSDRCFEQSFSSTESIDMAAPRCEFAYERASCTRAENLFRTYCTNEASRQYDIARAFWDRWCAQTFCRSRCICTAVRLGAVACAPPGSRYAQMSCRTRSREIVSHCVRSAMDVHAFCIWL